MSCSKYRYTRLSATHTWRVLGDTAPRSIQLYIGSVLSSDRSRSKPNANRNPTGNRPTTFGRVGFCVLLADVLVQVDTHTTPDVTVDPRFSTLHTRKIISVAFSARCSGSTSSAAARPETGPTKDRLTRTRAAGARAALTQTHAQILLYLALATTGEDSDSRHRVRRPEPNSFEGGGAHTHSLSRTLIALSLSLSLFCVPPTV